MFSVSIKFLQHHIILDFIFGNIKMLFFWKTITKLLWNFFFQKLLIYDGGSNNKNVFLMKIIKIFLKIIKNIFNIFLMINKIIIIIIKIKTFVIDKTTLILFLLLLFLFIFLHGIGLFWLVSKPICLTTRRRR